MRILKIKIEKEDFLFLNKTIFATRIEGHDGTRFAKNVIQTSV